MILSGNGLKTFNARLEENLAFLEKLAVGLPGIKQEHFLDLLANAKRRADLEQKYDDAIVRLYLASDEAPPR